jgi:MFS family permease
MLYSRSYITMGVANFFTVSSFGFFFLFPLYVVEKGGSKADIGMIMGVFALAAVLCRPWISEMIDRIGRKRSYSIGSLVMSGLPLTYLLLHGNISQVYVPLLIIRIFHGIGLAICFTSVFTYISDIVPDGRLNEGLGMFGTTGLTGLAVGPVIAEALIARYGFPIFFLAASGIAASGFLLQLPLPESYRNSERNDSPSFFSILGRRRTLTVLSLAFLFGYGLSAVGSFVSPFAVERKLSFISLYYLSYSVAAVFTRLLGGRIADRVGEERIIPYALLLTGSGLLLLIFLNGNLLLVLSGLMTGCGHGFLFPSLNAFAIRCEPPHIRGKITGAFTGGIDAGAFAGAITLGIVGQLAGFEAIFLGAGLALLLGLGIHRGYRSPNSL